MKVKQLEKQFFYSSPVVYFDFNINQNIRVLRFTFFIFTYNESDAPSGAEQEI